VRKNCFFNQPKELICATATVIAPGSFKVSAKYGWVDKSKKSVIVFVDVHTIK
jgi:hypothetical protein